MTRVRRALTLLAVAAMLSLPLAACTSPEEPGATSPRSTRPTPTGPIPTAVTDAEHRLGLKWNWSQLATLNFAAAAAGGATFTEVEWCTVEPVEGQFDWGRLDEIVEASVQLGHELMLKLRTGHCWATQPPMDGSRDVTEGAMKVASTMPLDMERYTQFVTEVVNRYSPRGVHTWAIENEVDVLNFWAAPVEQYAELARAVAPAVRAADPQAQILEGGASSTAYGVAVARSLVEAGDLSGALSYYQAFYARRIDGSVSRWPAAGDEASLLAVLDSEPALRATAAVQAAVELIGDGTVDTYQLHYYERSAQLPEVLAMIRARIGQAPIGAWEVGVAWPGADYDADEQAADAVRLIVDLLAAGVTRIVYLPLAYTPGPGPQVFRGLVEEDGTALPAGEAYLLLRDALVLNDTNELLVPGKGLHGLVLGTKPQVAWLWTDGAAAPLDLVASDSVQTLTGEPLEGVPTLGPTPIVVIAPEGGLASRLNATPAAGSSSP